MECGHSSIREYTKARGRGHAANLPEVSAKAVCRFIAKHHNHNFADHDAAKQQEDQVFPEAPVHRASGGGGPWRAFLSERRKGVKLSREIIRNLKHEYRQLSPEDYSHFKQLAQFLLRNTSIKRCEANRSRQKQTKWLKLQSPVRMHLL